IETINVENIKLNSNSLNIENHENDFKDNISNGIKTIEDKITLTQLINITDSQIFSGTWTNAISLLQKSDKIDELKITLSVLNDDLAFQVERILATPKTLNVNQITDTTIIIDNLVKGNILTAYSKFCYEQLKTDFSLISNYNGIAKMTDKIIKWKKQLESIC
ncbi:unnamed protein product, partial [Didymodactylos carnosus]